MDMNIIGLVVGLVGGFLVWMGLRADSSLVKVGGVAAIILAIVLQLNTSVSRPPLTSGLPSQLNGSPLSAAPFPSPLALDSSKEKAPPKPSPNEKKKPEPVDTGPDLTRREIRHIVRNNSPSPSPKPEPTEPEPTEPTPTEPTPTEPTPTEPTPTESIPT